MDNQKKRVRDDRDPESDDNREPVEGSDLQATFLKDLDEYEKTAHLDVDLPGFVVPDCEVDCEMDCEVDCEMDCEADCDAADDVDAGDLAEEVAEAELLKSNLVLQLRLRQKKQSLLRDFGLPVPDLTHVKQCPTLNSAFTDTAVVDKVEEALAQQLRIAESIDKKWQGLHKNQAPRNYDVDIGGVEAGLCSARENLDSLLVRDIINFDVTAGDNVDLPEFVVPDDQIDDTPTLDPPVQIQPTKLRTRVGRSALTHKRSRWLESLKYNRTIAELENSDDE